MVERICGTNTFCAWNEKVMEDEKGENGSGKIGKMLGHILVISLTDIKRCRLY